MLTSFRGISWYRSLCFSKSSYYTKKVQNRYSTALCIHRLLTRQATPEGGGLLFCFSDPEAFLTSAPSSREEFDRGIAPSYRPLHGTVCLEDTILYPFRDSHPRLKTANCSSSKIKNLQQNLLSDLHRSAVNCGA